MELFGLTAMKRSVCVGAAVALAALASSPWSQSVLITTPPPGSQVDISSAQVSGLVIGTPGQPAPFTEVYIRTLYQDGTRCAPIVSDGSYQQGALGWGYAVDWDMAAGTGTWAGRVKWLRPGTNTIEVYAPGDVLGTPQATQPIVFQNQAIFPTDMVAITHPTQRTIDVIDPAGNAGRIEFLVDLLNTTSTQTFNVDLKAIMELPDGSTVNLPMGGPGVDAASFTIGPNDYTYVSSINPQLVKFSFPLDQAPFPQPIQEGLYHMEIEVYEGTGLIFNEEDIDFWVTDRSGKPFRDITLQTAFKDVHLQGAGSTGAGIAAFDYNNDGLTDVFVANPGGDVVKNDALQFVLDYPGGRNYLMRNNGDGTFTDVTAQAGVVGNPLIRSFGVAWGDLNDDGFNDLVVANRQHRTWFYRNNGDGTFTDVPQGAITAIGWGQVPRIGDVDNDGDLDVYVATYVKDWNFDYQMLGWTNILYLSGWAQGVHNPQNPGWPGFAVAGLGNGSDVPDTTLATFFFDYNRDGNLDLAVHNDFGGFGQPNRLLEGNGDGTFTDVSAAMGYDVREFSMGAVAEDFDGDGYLDVYSTSMGRNSLLLGSESGMFTQAIDGSGAEGDFMTLGPQADGLVLDDNWSSIGFDYDRDRDVDLYVMGSDQYTTYQLPLPEIHPDSMFENLGGANFVQRASDLGLDNGGRGRGAILIDVDNDDDLDIIVSNETEGVTVSRNDFATANHYVGLRPVTRRTAPGGFNTLFSVTAGGETRVHELMASSNHSGQLDNMVQMGLGSETVAEVVAEWQRGGSTTVFQAAADTTHLIHETVIEVNGEIDGIAPVGTQPVVKLIGEPGKIAIAAIGEGPGPFFIGPAAFLDLAPVLAFLKVGTLNTDGEDLWDLGTMPASAAGLTAELQMVIVEIFEGTFPVKSGISTLTIQ